MLWCGVVLNTEFCTWKECCRQNTGEKGFDLGAVLVP